MRKDNTNLPRQNYTVLQKERLRFILSCQIHREVRRLLSDVSPFSEKDCLLDAHFGARLYAATLPTSSVCTFTLNAFTFISSDICVCGALMSIWLVVSV